MTPSRCMQALAGLLLASAACAQVPFALDTTFRTTIVESNVNSVLVQQGGLTVLSGNMKLPGDLYFRAGMRLLPNGAMDETFAPVPNMGGKLTGWNDRIYVGISSAVKRLFANGHIDPGFIFMDAGPYFSSLAGGDYHVYPDGRVLMSGRHILSDTVRGLVGYYNLVWFSNEGYLDTTRTHRRGNGNVFQFAPLPDGGFICQGTGSEFEGVPVGRIFKVDSVGVPDPVFQSDVFSGSAYTYLPLADGRVYVGGNFRRNADPLDTLRLLRFMPDGSLDPTFNRPNFTFVNGTYPVGPSVTQMTPFEDGKYFVMGSFEFVNSQPRRGICVIDSTGALGDEFDDCGVGPFDSGIFVAGSVHGITPYGDDHWLIWGSYLGYDDGVINDPDQRFVTRLHRGDFTTSTATLSVGEGPGMKLYPNPSTGVLHLSVEEHPRNAVVHVRDALGRTVLQRPLISHYNTVDLTTAGRGVYVVSVVAAGVRIAAQRVVVE